MPNFSSFLQKQITPFSKREEEEKGKGCYYNNSIYIHHSSLTHQEMAMYRFSVKQKLLIFFCSLLLLFFFFINWHTTLVTLFAFLTILYFTDLLFNWLIIFKSFKNNPEITIKQAQLDTLSDIDLPLYTIFCPLYKEWKVLPQFINGIDALDYPKEKLQVMLLLEEDDTETIDQIRKLHLPKHIMYEIVPNTKPRTKPKACNYGLLQAKGEYIVIYDAEDIPEPNQLKKVFLAFQQAPKGTICIQAKLTFYNPHHNLLTRLFTAEYALWFDLILTGLQSLTAPIPLGGTSNHFRKEDVIKLGGWDAFNVTEDCDLGIRLAKKGFTTAIVDSTTLEEANSNIVNWFQQRTRWIKGYIQTYFVHNRNFDTFSFKNFSMSLMFHIIVGGKVLCMLMNPFMWLITVMYFLFRAHVGTFIESFFPPAIFYMGITCFVFGNFLYMYNYMVACAKKGYDNLIKFVYLIPLYWLCMSIAAWLAFFEFLYKPHYWYKTSHGLHLGTVKTSEQVNKAIKKHMETQTLAHI